MRKKDKSNGDLVLQEQYILTGFQNQGTEGWNDSWGEWTLL